MFDKLFWWLQLQANKYIATRRSKFCDLSWKYGQKAENKISLQVPHQLPAHSVNQDQEIASLPFGTSSLLSPPVLQGGLPEIFQARRGKEKKNNSDQRSLLNLEIQNEVGYDNAFIVSEKVYKHINHLHKTTV